MKLTLVLAERETLVDVTTVIVAGWTGRDRAAVEQHMAELEELGVRRPSSVPVFYRVSASRLTTAPAIESTAASSGEVEAVLLRHAGRLWVGVGSDHTDRDVETYSVAVSKQLCDKPIAAELWPYDQVETYWDRLIVRSWITEAGAEVAYQVGTLEALLRPEELLGRVEPPFADGSIMFCGTLAARGGVRPAETFRYELEDPVSGRTLTARYDVRTLPLVS
jgi:hypothetical protein